MIILIILAVITLLGVCIEKFTNQWEVGAVLWIFSGSLLAVVLIIWPISYYGYVDSMIKYRELQITLDYARNNNASELERATIISKVAEANQDIRSAQYWNKTALDMFIPDEIMNFQQLK